MAVKAIYIERRFLTIYIILFLVLHGGCQSFRTTESNQIHSRFKNSNEQKVEELLRNASVVSGDNLSGTVVETQIGSDKASGVVLEQPKKKRIWPWILAGLIIVGIITAAIIAIATDNGDGGKGRIPPDEGPIDMIDGPSSPEI